MTDAAWKLCVCFFQACDENRFGHLLAWTAHTRAEEMFVVTAYGGEDLSAMSYVLVLTSVLWCLVLVPHGTFFQYFTLAEPLQ